MRACLSAPFDFMKINGIANILSVNSLLQYFSKRFHPSWKARVTRHRVAKFISDKLEILKLTFEDTILFCQQIFRHCFRIFSERFIIKINFRDNKFFK